MKFIAVALVAAGVASAQVVYENGAFKCLGDAADKNFCAGTSLETNIIIRCTGETGQPGNCNDNLAGIPPVGVKFAQCYQSSNTTGDAACSFQGIAYPDGGDSYAIPGYSSSSSSVTAAPTDSSSSASEYPSATTTDSSTMVTVTGIVTITTCETSCTAKPVPVPTGTGGTTIIPANQTSYTTGLPIPTQMPGSASALLAKDGLVLGVVAVIGFLFL